MHESRGFIKDIALLLGISPVELRNVYFQHNHLTNVENLDWYEMFNKVLAVFNVSKEKEDEVMRLLQERRSKRKINVELLSFFPILRRLGLKVGILSNSSIELRERLKKLGILDLVDVVVISGEIGFQKPHKEAFQIMFEKLNLLPQEVIFVDDSTKSLEKASEIGYVPVLFKNNAQLIIDLKNIGVSLL